eukprot:jgi/Antlo1/1635/2038
MADEDHTRTLCVDEIDILIEKSRVKSRIEALEKMETPRVLVQQSRSVLIFEDRARMLREERARRMRIEKKLLHTAKRNKVAGA